MLQLRQIRTSVNAPRVSEDAVLAARAGIAHRILDCFFVRVSQLPPTETPRDPQSVADLPHFLLCL